MTQEQISEMVIKNNKDIAVTLESFKALSRRMDENDALTSNIHNLARSVETLAFQVKTQNERMESLFDSFETRMKAQGERIGELEKKPGKKWDMVVEKVLMLVLTAVVVFLLARVGL